MASDAPNLSLVSDDSKASCFTGSGVYFDDQFPGVQDASLLEELCKDRDAAEEAFNAEIEAQMLRLTLADRAPLREHVINLGKFDPFIGW